MMVASRPLGGLSGHDAAWALLEELYRSVQGEPMPPVRILEGGKPCFTRGLWHFSLTHTPRRAFAVLSRFPVGIDAEELDRRFSPKLPGRVLSPGELAQYAAAEDKTRAFLTFWVLKEATVKATGEGLRRFPNDTDFSLSDPRVTQIDGCLVAIVERKETYDAV